MTGCLMFNIVMTEHLYNFIGSHHIRLTIYDFRYFIDWFIQQIVFDYEVIFLFGLQFFVMWNGHLTTIQYVSLFLLQFFVKPRSNNSFHFVVNIGRLFDFCDEFFIKFETMVCNYIIHLLSELHERLYNFVSFDLWCVLIE